MKLYLKDTKSYLNMEIVTIAIYLKSKLNYNVQCSYGFTLGTSNKYDSVKVKVGDDFVFVKRNKLC